MPPVQIAARSRSMKERIDSLESDLRQSSEGRDEQVGVILINIIN